MTSDDDSSDSSDEEVGASTLNSNASPYVPQSSEELVTNEEQDLRTPTQDVRATTTVLRPTNSMIRAHPPTQMLSSVTDGVRTRSSYETLLANHAFVSLQEPKNIKDALLDPDWVEAMQEELQEFKRNQVWRLVPQPQKKSVIGTRWVFRNKVDDQGAVVRNKARLVAQG